MIAREYFTLTGNTFTREYKVDDTLLPNAYIGVVALAPMNSGSTRSYAVGYGEILADATQKEAILTLTPDKLAYKNRESVTLDMTFSDRSGNPLQ